ncbi:MAG: hypothetical protein RSE32_07285 [Comamonas sp.]|uniref:hypothetical protein n=1 Tax=Comamonas sp. TaxID=34028 RepID=UPI002FCB0F6C
MAGKPLTIGALLVLLLIIAAKCEWTIAASVVFAYFTYFVLSFAVMHRPDAKKMKSEIQPLIYNLPNRFHQCKKQ